MRRTTWALAAILVVLGGGGAFAGGSDGADEAGPLGVDWTAVEIGGAPTDAAVRSTLRLDDGNAAGTAGCNRYTGDARLDGATLRLGPLAATRMACPPPQSDQETRFLAALDATRGWSIGADGRLSLHDGTGAVIAILRR